MAGPLGGVGQTRIPFANTFQPGKLEPQVRERENDVRKTEDVKTRDVASTRDDTEVKDARDLQNLLKEAESTTEKDRGSNVDITV